MCIRDRFISSYDNENPNIHIVCGYDGILLFGEAKQKTIYLPRIDTCNMGEWKKNTHGFHDSRNFSYRFLEMG